MPRDRLEGEGWNRAEAHLSGPLLRHCKLVPRSLSVQDIASDYESTMLQRHGLERTEEDVIRAHLNIMQPRPSSEDRRRRNLENFLDRQSGRKANHCSGLEIGADYNQFVLNRHAS